MLERSKKEGQDEQEVRRRGEIVYVRDDLMFILLFPILFNLYLFYLVICHFIYLFILVGIVLSWLVLGMCYIGH